MPVPTTKRPSALLAVATSLLAAACGSNPSGARGDGQDPGAGQSGSDASSPGSSDRSSPASCSASCNGKQCGTDACGGTCGSCPATSMCSAAGNCVAPSGDTTFQVDAQAGLSIISSAIYGVAFSEATSLDVSTLQRFGGDCSSMYNWQVDAFNCGADWQHANQALLGFGYPPYNLSNIPAGATGSDWLVTFDRQHHVDTLMTVPMIGWVAKDRSSQGDTSGGDPGQDAVAAGGPFMQSWIGHMVSTFGGAASGGVKYYQLDNEVDNWVSMHGDVHPKPATSSEIWSGIRTYGAAIKAADPAATVLVYSPALVASLLYSPADFASLGSDRPFVPPAFSADSNNFSTWLLQQAAAYEKANGVRVLDCLDMHYPTAGRHPVEDVRSLWDATYDEGSWETQDAYGGPLDLLPRMQKWIADNYPGTGICISEYQYFPPTASDGTPDPASGVTEADALGLFGKYGVKLAAYWTTLVDSSGNVTPTYNAFAMYRNYDGAGAHFGDYVASTSSTMTDVTAYGAVDSPSSPSTLQVMLINKTTSTRSDLGLEIDHFSAAASAHVYQTTGSKAPLALSDLPIAGGVARVSLPPLSITLLVIPKG